VEVGLGHLDGHAVVDALEERVLVVPDRDRLKLVCRRDNLEQALELGRLLDRRRERLDSDVRNVVERRDHAEVVGFGVHLVLDNDAVRLLEVVDRVLDKLGQVLCDVRRRRALEVVETGFCDRRR
jgi:hypothetical protein